MTLEESNPEPVEASETVIEYKPGPNAIDISPAKDGGVIKEIIKEGEGTQPAVGCKVRVHYDGRLLDGTPFDSSRDRGEPFEFQLGKGKVIKGWDIGVATMKKGEKANIICQSEYAYGKSGSPPKIPPNATLIFEIEVLDWDPEDLSSRKDGSILRFPIEPGEGFSTPNEGATVEIHLIGEHEGRIFDERDVKFQLGEGAEENVPPGVEKALEKFVCKEKSKLVLKPQTAFGSAGQEKFGIPGGATVSYTVTLNKFENLKDSWALESSEKLELAKTFKEKGTNYFKAEKYQLALKMYKKMVTYLEYDYGFTGDLETDRKSLLLAAYLNSTMCYLKLQQHNNAKNECSKVFEQDPNNVKAYFRRGQAYLGLNDPELAKSDFEKVLQLDPNNKAAASQVLHCKSIIKEFRGKEKQIYANMFEKYTQKKEWRYGWWDKDKVVKQVMKENPELELARKKELEMKKAFLEERAKLMKEAREEKKIKEAEQEGKMKENIEETEQEGDVKEMTEEKEREGDVEVKTEEKEQEGDMKEYNGNSATWIESSEDQNVGRGDKNNIENPSEVSANS